MRWVVPFNDLRPSVERNQSEILAAIRNVVASGNYILGPQVEKFEGWLRERTGRKHALGLANGTDAIEVALRAVKYDLAVPDRWFVLTVANSAPATVAAIKRAGLRPRYVDVRPDGQMDVEALEKANWRKVCAVVPVHLHGLAPDMYAIAQLARQHEIPVIEDAAQAFGSCATGWGTVTCYSFYPTKTLGALGDGGAVVTDDAVLANTMRAIRFYGMSEVDRPELRQTYDGVNSRLDEIQAAILNVRARAFDAEQEERRAMAEYYYRRIHPSFLPWRFEERKDKSFHLFTVRVKDRDGVRNRMAAYRAVQTTIHYPIPAHEQNPTYSLEELPQTEAFCRETLSLPLYVGMSRKDQDWVLQAFEEATT